MSLSVRVLSAAALAFLPAAAGAQVTGSRVNPGVNPAAERDRAADTGESADAEAERDPAAAEDSDRGAEAGATVLADPSDIRVGAEVRDPEGGLVGTIESVDSDGAVVTTGQARAKLPLGSFGKNDRGLVISLTRAELEAAARAQGGG